MSVALNIFLAYDFPAIRNLKTDLFVWRSKSEIELHKKFYGDASNKIVWTYYKCLVIKVCQYRN